MGRKREKRVRNGRQSSQWEAALRWTLPHFLPRGCYWDHKLPALGNWLVPFKAIKGTKMSRISK